MYGYTLTEWLLFFYIYCILGWCWETPFVSIRKRKFINRGFMVGPWLPIYGSGAIAILLGTLPVRDNIYLVFLLGMLSATVLEYVTGSLMEAMFKVRYWDYSNLPLNLNGHICLFCSLGWGVFSVILVKIIHSPIEAFLLDVDSDIKLWCSVILSVIIAADFTISFRAAMDLRDILENITKSHNEIKRLKKRLDVLVAVLDDERQQLIMKYDAKLSNTKQRYGELYSNIRDKFTVLEYAKNGMDRFKSFSTDELMNEYMKLKSMFSVITRLNKERNKSINIWVKRVVKGNPMIKSKSYGEAAEELKDIIFRKVKIESEEVYENDMIKDNYKEIDERVAKACERCGRDRSDVTLIAVSKTKPVEMILDVMELGVVDFGENKVQEMCGKIEVIDKPLKWHLIGHLQRNKVKYIVDKAYLIHSVDSLRLAAEIEKEAVKADVDCNILIEVNIGGEDSKDGVTVEEAPALIEEISKLSRVKVKGLMTVAPPADNPEDNRKYFAGMKELSEKIKAMKLPNVEMKELSMGMTGDFEVAIEEGATMVRVGTAIFGERNYNI